MKKKFIVILCVALLLVIMGGVVGSMVLRNSNQNLLKLLEEDGAKNENLKETKVTFYFDSDESKNIRDILDQVEKKSKAKLNMKIDFQFIENSSLEFVNKIQKIIASGEPCDAFFARYKSNETLKGLVEKNMIKDLTTVFPQYAPNYFSSFSTEDLKGVSGNDRIYAIPSHFPTSQMICAMVQEDLMKKYNIPDINNLEDFEFYLETLKTHEPTIYPVLNISSTLLTRLFAEANGYAILEESSGLVYKWDDPDMKIIPWEQTPAFGVEVETLNRWNSKGYFKAQSRPDNKALTNGSKIFGSIITNLGGDIVQIRNLGIMWRYKMYPLYPNNISERNSPVGESMMISANSENTERILMFYEWLQSSQQNYDSLMYGVNKTDYSLKDDRVILPQGVDARDSLYSWGWRVPFLNIDYERENEYSPDSEMEDYAKIIKEKTQYPPHMGFEIDNDYIRDVGPSKRNFLSLNSELQLGNKSKADIDNFVKEQKEGGIDQMIEIIQKQFDEWRNKK